MESLQEHFPSPSFYKQHCASWPMWLRRNQDPSLFICWPRDADSAVGHINGNPLNIGRWVLMAFEPLWCSTRPACCIECCRYSIFVPESDASDTVLFTVVFVANEITAISESDVSKLTNPLSHDVFEQWPARIQRGQVRVCPGSDSDAVVLHHVIRHIQFQPAFGLHRLPEPQKRSLIVTGRPQASNGGGWSVGPRHEPQGLSAPPPVQ